MDDTELVPVHQDTVEDSYLLSHMQLENFLLLTNHDQLDINEKGEIESMKTNTFSETPYANDENWIHHKQFGQDLSGLHVHANKSIGMISDFLEMTALWTASIGKRKLFIVCVYNLLVVKNIEKRHAIHYHGPVSFLECTQLCKFKQSCHGNVITFQMRTGNDWWLGVVQSIHPMDAVPCTKIFVWTETLKIPAKPIFATGWDARSGLAYSIISVWRNF